MRILIVEDSPHTRQLLLYLLQERFMKEAKFREAHTLKTAFDYLRMWKDNDKISLKKGEDPDHICVILDLSLPDSAGKETFLRIYEEFPDIPIVVMTNTNDRQLAEEMVDLGAQDYILKNFTDEEEIFRRVSFAIRRHRRTVSMPPGDASSIHRLESSRAALRKAHNSGEYEAVEDSSYQVLESLSEIIKKSFVGIQDLHIKVEKSQTLQEVMREDINYLKVEVRGSGGRRSIRSELEIIDNQLSSIKSDYNSLSSRVDRVEDKSEEADKSSKFLALKLNTNKTDNRTKVVVAIISLIGLIATSYIAYRYGLQP